MFGLPWLALTFHVNICWQNILELFQGYGSNPLNVKELMHQVWLDMIKFNAPTHELKKPNIENKQENIIFRN